MIFLLFYSFHCIDQRQNLYEIIQQIDSESSFDPKVINEELLKDCYHKPNKYLIKSVKSQQGLFSFGKKSQNLAKYEVKQEINTSWFESDNAVFEFELLSHISFRKIIIPTNSSVKIIKLLDFQGNDTKNIEQTTSRKSLNSTNSSIKYESIIIFPSKYTNIKSISIEFRAQPSEAISFGIIRFE